MGAIAGNSTDPNTAGVTGENTAPTPGGVGVEGISSANDGVRAVSTSGNGLSAFSTSGVGVFAETQSATYPAVYATSTSQPGVIGTSQSSDGVRANSTSGNGLSARSASGVGVFAETQSATYPAVYATSTSQPGVIGTSQSSDGVRANSTSGNGLSSRSVSGVGVFAETQSTTYPAVYAANTAGVGIFAQGPVTAAFFQGNITVMGDIALSNQDCAEDFDIAGLEQIEPGTVMVLDEEGTLRQSEVPYDRKVAGVISGAGDYKPAIVLGKREFRGNRVPIALLGKVYCKADAKYSPIEVGDLLTTSPTPGHAMKVTDPFNALGTVLGKALRPLRAGQGLIPILIALQ